MTVDYLLLNDLQAVLSAWNTSRTWFRCLMLARLHWHGAGQPLARVSCGWPSSPSCTWTSWTLLVHCSPWHLCSTTGSQVRTSIWRTGEMGARSRGVKWLAFVSIACWLQGGGQICCELSAFFARKCLLSPSCTWTCWMLLAPCSSWHLCSTTGSQVRTVAWEALREWRAGKLCRGHGQGDAKGPGWLIYWCITRLRAS